MVAGRPPNPRGWSLREPRGREPFYVRFRWAERDFELSCGPRDYDNPARDRAIAREAAARRYAHTVATYRATTPGKVRPSSRAAADFEKAVDGWLAALEATHDPGTVRCYGEYFDSHWSYFFPGLHDVTTQRCEEYRNARLGKVQASTVRKELSALRNFIGWAVSRKLMRPVEVAGVPKRAVGTPHPQRRRQAAIELSPQEVAKLIAALPEWSTSPRVLPHPIRARFVVQYETGLRADLISALEVPKHYRRGAKEITITPDLDKLRFARKVRISDTCRAALDSVIPKGVKGARFIFGHHDYRQAIRKAALVAIKPRERAKAFCGAHLRSARMTHWLDGGASITALMWQTGLKRVETVTRYARAGKRAGDALIVQLEADAE
jgi:integrase